MLQGWNKFCLNCTITERVMTLCRFSRWRPYRRKYSFAFWFYDSSLLERQGTICVLNFDQISQSTATLLLLLVANVCHIWIVLPVSTNSSPSSAFCDFALAYQILCKSDDRRRSYDVILILQDGGHSVANLLPVSDLATCGDPELSA